MHERFEFDIRHGLMYRANLVYTQLTRQDDTLKAHVTQMCHVFRCAVVALGRSMQTDRRQVEVQ